MVETLDRLKEQLADITNLNRAAALLNWDQQTHMPSAGAAARAAQLATLGRISHEMFTSAELKTLLDAAAEDVKSLPYDSDEAALVRVTLRDWEDNHKVPSEFIAEVSQHGATSRETWVRAREQNDFALFAPCLEKTIELSRRLAEYLGYEDQMYDALLGQFEPGMKTAQVKAIFDALKVDLVPLVHAIGDKVNLVDDSILHGSFDEGVQEKFSRFAAEQIGYDFSRGRLDRTVHPFANGLSRNDVRITTRFDPTWLNPALFGTLHEAGHALYEQGLGENLDGTPLAHGTSLGIHESQSRLWENVVGRGHGFWQRFFPVLQEYFPEQFSGVDLETFYRAINKVHPSLIRVEADEVTYNLHIMVRFEMELGMLDGSIPVADAPAVWNAKMKEYLGIEPPNDTLGILQDVHWSHGIMGYFTTYSLGTILSLQLYDAAVAAHPEIPGDMAEGRFDLLREWLTENIYQHGRKFEPGELVERATGEPLQSRSYVRYLREKFGEMYGLDVTPATS